MACSIQVSTAPEKTKSVAPALTLSSAHASTLAGQTQPLMAHTLGTLSKHLKTVVGTQSAAADTPATPQLTKEPSLQELQELLYNVLQHLNIDLGDFATAQAKLQSAQAKLAEAIAAETDQKTQEFQDALEKAKEAADSIWGKISSFLGEVFGSTAGQVLMGGLAIALAALTGGVAGAVIATVMVAASFKFPGCSSSGMEYASNGIADGLGGGKWAKFGVSLGMTLATTLASGGLEGWYSGASTIRFGVATATTLSTSLTVTNPIYNLAVAAGASEEDATYIGMAVNIALSIGAYGAAMKAPAVDDALTKLLGGTDNLGAKLQAGMNGLMAVSSTGESFYGVAGGVVDLQTADALNLRAPIQEMLTLLKGITSVNNTANSIAQKAYTSAMSSIANAFNINFANEWQTVARATQEIAG